MVVVVKVRLRKKAKSLKWLWQKSQMALIFSEMAEAAREFSCTSLKEVNFKAVQGSY